MPPYAFSLTILLYAVVGIDGTWELTRVFRSGPVPGVRAVPIDSTTFVRLTLSTERGGWIVGTLDRRYQGEPEHTRVQGTEAEGPGRYILSYLLHLPTWERGETVAWLVEGGGGVGGDTLRLGTALVPGADSLELKRVNPEAPYPGSVLELVTPPHPPYLPRPPRPRR